MSRTPRSYLPGAVFHLTARTQGHEPWFTTAVRTRLVEFIAHAFAVSDARLLAFAVMPNHIHLVIQQGRWTLGRVVQPLLRRSAGLVHTRHQTEGHVFERRFRDRPCIHPYHARNTIAYVNLNPVRAGLVDDPGDYPWTSHRRYAAPRAGQRCMEGVLAVECGLRLFGTGTEASLAEQRRAYAEFLAWRIQRDNSAHTDTHGPADTVAPTPWASTDGDWSRPYAPLFTTGSPTEPARDSVRPRPHPHPMAQAIARQSGVELEKVRSSYKGKAVARTRRDIVIRLDAVGHRPGAIARYLRVTPQCVSNILARHRPAADSGS